MGILSEYKKKNLKRRSEKLTARLQDARKESELAEAVNKKQRELDSLNTKINKASPTKRYLSGVSKVTKSAAKSFVNNSEKIGNVSAQMGANLLGTPYEAPVKKGKLPNRKRSVKRKPSAPVYVYSKRLGGYIEKRR